LALVFRASLLAYFGTHFRDLPLRRTSALTVVTGGILGSLLTGSIPGIVIGSWMTIHVPDRTCDWLSPPFCSSSAAGW
jgi:hypothetical protein